MGACYDEIEKPIKTKYNLRKNAWCGIIDKEEIKKWFKDACDDSRYEDGHSYSGCIGMKRELEFQTDKIFKNYIDAYNYVCDNAEKWGPAIAVRYVGSNDQQFVYIGAWCSS